MNNLILRADAYKYGHKGFFPKNIQNNFSYVESRGIDMDGPLPFGTEIVFFGLQMFVHKYLLTPITKEDVDKAEKLILSQTGIFNREDWDIIVNEFGGFLPILITGLPEGTITKPGIMLANVVATDERFAWLASFVETAMLRSIWYPTTVATLSREIKKIIKYYLDLSCDNPADELPFKLHDFGARGVSSAESAAIGGLAHLVNFMGTDTIEAIPQGMKYYKSGVCGFSIPASEHSTITAWGRENELAAYENMLDEMISKNQKIFACVSDSYNIYDSVDNLWPQLKDKIVDNDMTIVIRPDSGDAIEVVRYILNSISKSFGYTINHKGFKVLKNIRIIYGDSITSPFHISEILGYVLAMGFSTENIAFGMGGGLLQQVNRDTLMFAQKTSSIFVKGVWRDVYKDPIDAPFKKSKRGVMKNILEDGEVKTVVEEKSYASIGINAVYYSKQKDENVVCRTDIFEKIRARAEVA
ncbi:MAG: nicotinate phosphoribosyltransferase [Hyphomicrobiales bacterium]|nr:MAG: nicotinate phosphoribosyltransferase [Hyphomicrobiales bacterium]